MYFKEWKLRSGSRKLRIRVQCRVLKALTKLRVDKRVDIVTSCIVRLKRDGTRAETRFRLSAKGRVHLNRRGRQFSPLLAAEVCASAVVVLDTPCSEVV